MSKETFGVYIEERTVLFVQMKWPCESKMKIASFISKRFRWLVRNLHRSTEYVVQVVVIELQIAIKIPLYLHACSGLCVPSHVFTAGCLCCLERIVIILIVQYPPIPVRHVRLCLLFLLLYIACHSKGGALQ